jgi:hypothetical protein
MFDYLHFSCLLPLTIYDCFLFLLYCTLQEVHDVSGRLDRIVQLLREHEFQVVIEQQLPDVSEDGYFSFVPKELQLYMVYARRDAAPPTHKSSS